MREIHRETDVAVTENTDAVGGIAARIVVAASGHQVGFVREATPEALQMLGRDASELIGRNISCILPEQIMRSHDHLVRRFAMGSQVRSKDVSDNEIIDTTRELFAIHPKLAI